MDHVAARLAEPSIPNKMNELVQTYLKSRNIVLLDVQVGGVVYRMSNIFIYIDVVVRMGYLRRLRRY